MTTHFPTTYDYILKLTEYADGELKLSSITDREERRQIVLCLFDDILGNNNAGDVEISELIIPNSAFILPLFRFISNPLEHERAYRLSEELVDHIFSNFTCWLADIINDAQKDYWRQSQSEFEEDDWRQADNASRCMDLQEFNYSPERRI